MMKAKNVSMDQVFEKRARRRKKGSRDILWSIHCDVRDLVAEFAHDFDMTAPEAEKLTRKVVKHFLQDKTHRVA